MSGNKAGYYRVATKSELEYATKPRGKSENTSILTEDTVYRVMNEIAKTNPNFFDLSKSVALQMVKKELEKRGWEGISSTSSSISGPGEGGGKITFYVKDARNAKKFILRRKKNS